VKFILRNDFGCLFGQKGPSGSFFDFTDEFFYFAVMHAPSLTMLYTHGHFALSNAVFAHGASLGDCGHPRPFPFTWTFFGVLILQGPISEILIPNSPLGRFKYFLQATSQLWQPVQNS
jgi:hypothetical protein